VRDVGKVLGIPEDMTKALSSQVWSFSREEIEEKHARDMGLDLTDRRLRLTWSWPGNCSTPPATSPSIPAASC
jgi:DNA polymerase III alpha subunit